MQDNGRGDGRVMRGIPIRLTARQHEKVPHESVDALKYLSFFAAADNSLVPYGFADLRKSIMHVSKKGVPISTT